MNKYIRKSEMKKKVINKSIMSYQDHNEDP